MELSGPAPVENHDHEDNDYSHADDERRLMLILVMMMMVMEETKLMTPEPTSYSSAMSWIAHGWQCAE